MKQTHVWKWTTSSKSNKQNRYTLSSWTAGTQNRLPVGLSDQSQRHHASVKQLPNNAAVSQPAPNAAEETNGGRSEGAFETRSKGKREGHDLVLHPDRPISLAQGSKPLVLPVCGTVLTLFFLPDCHCSRSIVRTI